MLIGTFCFLVAIMPLLDVLVRLEIDGGLAVEAADGCPREKVYCLIKHCLQQPQVPGDIRQKVSRTVPQNPQKCADEVALPLQLLRSQPQNVNIPGLFSKGNTE